jgi:HEAT repeat protein
MTLRMPLTSLFVAGLMTLAPEMALAQQATLPAAAIPVEEAAAITSGWALLAEGKHDEASGFATNLLARFPRNISALALAVEVEIARGGPAAGLARYEDWIGARSAEEPGVLRRIARAVLHEWGRQATDGATRAQALEALALDGDQNARAVLVEAAGAGSAPELASLAALGSDEAVDSLIARLSSAPGDRRRVNEALGGSRNARALPALVEALGDPNDATRVTAAGALGRLGQAAAVEPLKAALNDPRGAVRLEAAGALFELGDYSAYNVLSGLLSDPNPQVRISGVALMASRPDAAWMLEVERLTRETDAFIRLQAARLVAPHNPALAESVVRALVDDLSPGIREAAVPVLADILPDDLTALRQILRRPEGPAKVRAAARILGLTR